MVPGRLLLLRLAGTRNSLPNPITVSTVPSTGLAPGVTKDCVRWYQTSGGDDCDLVVSIFGQFSKADFLTWDPSVGSDCTTIKDDLYYCVAVSNTPATLSPGSRVSYRFNDGFNGADNDETDDVD